MARYRILDLATSRYLNGSYDIKIEAENLIAWAVFFDPKYSKEQFEIKEIDDEIQNTQSS